MCVPSEFRIAELQLQLHVPFDFPLGENLRPFSDKNREPDWTVRFEKIDEIQVPQCGEVYRVYPFAVFECDEDFVRYFHVHTDHDKPYAIFRADWNKGQAYVQYLPEAEKLIPEHNGIFAHIGFEELLLSRERVILHASLVDTQYGGILFSGPSGVGKSTQAELWKTYANGIILNGDRPILSKAEEGWRAYGSPFAGSSEYYINASAPVTAIIMLEQGSECAIHRLGVAEAFRRLYAQTTVNTWNQQYVGRMCDLLMDMAVNVPVYHMVCTPDQAAVETVKKLFE